MSICLLKVFDWRMTASDRLRHMTDILALSIEQSDFVVMVSTEAYVGKILGNTGGAGFEHMLVMGNLMRELTANRFLPVIRQSSTPFQLIPALATRAYVDLSTDLHYRERVEDLARAVHRQRPTLPPLGRPPAPLPPVR